MSAQPNRHPLLGLPPAARRALAQALVAEAEAQVLAQHRQGQRQGLVGGAFGLGGVGALTLAWTAATGLGAAPALAFGLAFLGVQGLAGRAWVRRLPEGEAPEGLGAALALAPYRAALGAKLALQGPRLSEATLLAAATAFAALRRPQAKALLRGVLGRGWPLAEVDAGLALLARIGWAEAGPAPHEGLWRLSPKGQALAQKWQLPPAQPRGREEPKLPPAVVAAFQAFAQAAAQSGELKAPAPLPTHMAPPAAPPSPTPAPVARPQAEAPVWPPAMPPAAPAVAPPPRPTPAPGPTAPAKPSQPPRQATGPLPAPASPRRRPWPWVAVALGGVAAIALAVLGPHWPWGGEQDGAAWAIASAPMPEGSLGVALQGDGHGMLLSLFEGGLYWSVPDRLDYKAPLKLQGLDTPSACHVGRGRVRFAAASPSGRFLWLELGGPRGAEEACLVDLETKSVHHAPAVGLGPPAAPAFVGWAAEGEPVVAEAPPPAAEARWWRLRPFGHQAQALQTPHAEALLPAAGPDGLLRVLALDPQSGGWSAKLLYLEGLGFELAREAQVKAPSGWSSAAPRRAALAPDQRLALLALAGGSGNALLVANLEDGRSQEVPTAQAVDPEAPLLWEGPPRGGKYRFVFTAAGPGGPRPRQGSVALGAKP